MDITLQKKRKLLFQVVHVIVEKTEMFLPDNWPSYFGQGVMCGTWMGENILICL